MTLYIATWIANLLILGIAVIIWLIALFGLAIGANMIKDFVERITKGEETL
tara:strand:+ start:1417 stop:1569 length:153 start_codon:yes stop_codon:yes gene_type:complete